MASKKPIKYTAIPRNNSDKAISALSTIAETLIGAKGNGLEKAVTFRDLETLDLVTIRRSLDGRNLIFDPIDPGDGDDDTVITPLRPTNFTATGGFTSVLLRWDFPTYGGHSYTEIWRAETNVLGNAALLVNTNSLNYSDIPGNNFTGYYWARHVNSNGVPGPYHDTSGELGQTAEDVEFNLSVLNGQIAEIHLSSYLSGRIDLIQVNNNAVTAQLALINGLSSDIITAESTLTSGLNSANIAIAAANARITSENAAVYVNIDTLGGVVSDIISATDTDRFTFNAGFVDVADRFTIVETDAGIVAANVLLIANTLNDPSTGLPATRATLLNNYSTTTTVNTAIATSVEALEAVIFTPDGTALNSAFTAIVGTALVTEDSALASQITGLDAIVTNSTTGLVATRATVTSNYTALATADSALSTRIDTLDSSFNDPATGLTATRATIDSNYTTLADADIAVASRMDTLESTFGNGEVNFDTVIATIEENYTTLASADTAIASTVTALSSQVNNASTGLPATRATVSSNYTTLAEADTALASSINALSSQVNNSTTGLPATRATVSENLGTLTTADTALSTRITTLDSEVNDETTGLPATRATVSSNYTALALVDSAIAANVTALSSQVNNTTTGLPATRATLINDYYTSVDADTAIATARTSLRSEIFDGAGSALQGAFVDNIDTAVANNAGGSIATSITSLSATLNDETTGLAATRATVTSNYNAVVNDTGDIISSHIAAFSVTANGVTNTLSQWAEVAADSEGVTAQWGVKTDINGLVGGIGLYNDGTVIQLTVQADRFAIIAPGDDTVQSLFATVVGDPVLPDGVYINTAFIKVATIGELVVGDVNADTVTAGISISTPVITAGSMTGSLITAVAGTQAIQIRPGNSIPFWFGTNALSRTIANAKFAFDNSGNVYARGITIYDNAGNTVLSASGALRGASISNLSVGTLDIQGNAVVLPYAIETPTITFDTGTVGTSWQELLNLTYDAGVSAMMVYFLVIQVRLTYENSSQVDRFSARVELRDNGTLVDTLEHNDIPIDILDSGVNQVVYLPLTASHFYTSTSVGIRVQLRGSNTSQIFVTKITGTVQSAKR
jgi:hypothetical protein